MTEKESSSTLERSHSSNYWAESVALPTPTQPLSLSPLARDAREANRDPSIIPLPPDYQIRLFIYRKFRPFEIHNHAADKTLLMELCEFFTAQEAGHLPEQLLNALRSQHLSASAAGSSYSRSSAESSILNAEGTSGVGGESGEQPTSLAIRHQSAFVHARGYMFVTLKFWFNCTDPNNLASNCERDTDNASSISRSNFSSKRNVELLEEAIKNLLFKSPYFFNGELLF